MLFAGVALGKIGRKARKSLREEAVWPDSGGFPRLPRVLPVSAPRTGVERRGEGKTSHQRGEEGRAIQKGCTAGGGGEKRKVRSGEEGNKPQNQEQYV